MNQWLTGKDFTKEIFETDGLAIVQFKTEWNGGCQIIAPIYEELCRSYAEKARFFTVDILKEKLIAKEYAITELPTILFFRNGELIDHIIGLIPKKMLIAKIENAITGKSKDDF